MNSLLSLRCFVLSSIVEFSAWKRASQKEVNILYSTKDPSKKPVTFRPLHTFPQYMCTRAHTDMSIFKYVPLLQTNGQLMERTNYAESHNYPFTCRVTSINKQNILRRVYLLSHLKFPTHATSKRTLFLFSEKAS